MISQDKIPRGLITISSDEFIDVLKQALKFPEIQKVMVISEAFDFQKFFIKRSAGITRTALNEAVNDIEFKNLDADSEIENISLIPSTDFKTKGAAQILINGAVVGEIEAGSCTDLDVINVPLTVNRKKFERSRSFIVRIWSSDGTSVNLTAFVLVGKKIN